MFTCSIGTVEDFGSFESTEDGAKGWMTKEGLHVRTWKRRFFLLKGDSFSYWAYPGDREAKGYIQLGIHKAQISEQTLKQLQSRPNDAYFVPEFEGHKGFLFELCTKTRTYRIICDDEQSMHSWVELLNSKIQSYALDQLFTSQEDEKKKNTQIDKMLEKEFRSKHKQVKLLLLGTGESGKSTIFKQMKILQVNGGYSEEELLSFKPVIYSNCISQMKVLLKVATTDLGLVPDNPFLEEKMEHLNDLPPNGDTWNRDVADAILLLWASQFIQNAYSQHRHLNYHLNETAAYFFENIQRIGKEDFIPTEQDVLRARVRSTGIEEAEFKFDNLEFRMIDVGGQRSERRKWIHCFDCVTAVIFCVAINEYNQQLREDSSTNRVHESLLLFEEICNMAWFKDTAFILFLNKTYLFKEKISQNYPLTACFPEYTGQHTYDEAAEYIKNKFLEQNTSPHIIYTHFTCAINTQNIKFVWKAVRETILNNIMNDIF